MPEHNSSPPRITSDRLALLRESLLYAAVQLSSAGFTGYATECREVADLINPAIGCRRRVLRRVLLAANKEYLCAFSHPARQALLLEWTPNVEDAGEFPCVIAEWLAKVTDGEVEEVES